MLELAALLYGHEPTTCRKEDTGKGEDVRQSGSKIVANQAQPPIRSPSQTVESPSHAEAATQEKAGQTCQNQAHIVSLFGIVAFTIQRV